MKSLQLAFCLLAVAGICSAQIVPMTNDDCATAITVFDGVNPGAPAGLSGNLYTNTGSTVSVGSPAFCAASGADVWFAYSPLATGNYVIKTCTPAGFAAGTNADTVVQVLDGTACPPTIVLGCDDDGCGAAGTGLPSNVNVCNLTLGSNYYIRVCGWAGGLGTFYVVVSPLPAPAVANDECSGAIPLVLGANGPFTNAPAVDGCVGASATCGFGGSYGFKDVWYSYTAGCGGLVDVSTVCTGLDTVVSAYAFCGGPEIACNDDDPLGCGLGSRMVFPTLTGATYLIRVGTYSAAGGAFTLTVATVAGMSLNAYGPFGPGSLQIDITGGPLGGLYFMPLTGVAGSFPLGWFYGLDLGLAELSSLITAGFPFIGPLDPACGGFTIGPIGGIGFLSGITLYMVALGIPPFTLTPSIASPPVAFTIP